ncbi:hypothetical protein MML48_9g00002696 [Holotrichia oblita]|uniref:Uncharacterized protein n=1 Tax=Holotrichia oblita TaxID=644536 RepID=A0ACB9SLR8_HOLOL|nr:hypothetical protein MML48_9g00002696 [Holotrichia oblita]
MDTSERDFKTREEHWALIVDYLEINPFLLKSKFQHAGGDHHEFKIRWEELVLQLNNLGYGAKSLSKWARAIPLTVLEERLMAVMGWRTVAGDVNKEIGLAPWPTSTTACNGVSPPLATRQATPPPTPGTSLEVPPPLAALQVVPPETLPACCKVVPDLRPMHRKEQASKGPSTPITRRVVPGRTEQTRKFVTLSHMHTENMAVLKSIDRNVVRLAHAVESLTFAVEKLSTIQDQEQ